MKSKFGIFSVLFFVLFTTVVSCTKSPNTNATQESNYYVRISEVASSTTGITISWVDDKGDNMNYTVSVYKDEACKELYQSYTLTFDVNEEKRFSIPYLDSQNRYYICVENINGSISKPYPVNLTATRIRRDVMSHNFDNLFWGYDYINAANGVKLKDKEPSSYIIDNLTDAIADSEVTSKIDDHGGLLFKYRVAMRELLGFKEWDKDKNKNVRIMPGYVKLGTASEVGILCTPAFTALGEDSDRVDISFSACIFASSLQSNGGKVVATIYKGDGTVHSTKECNMKGINGKPSWDNFKFSAEGVTSDCYFSITSTSATKQICIDNLKIVRHLTVPEGCVYGYVSVENSGDPIADIVISDGFSVTTTDKDGLYILKPHRDAMYVYYSIPEDCEVIAKARGPIFYSELTSGTKEYNFDLRKLPNGKEEKFALFTFADPQVSSNTALSRFQKEAVPGIKAHSETLGIPCYGITLGDVVSTTDSSNTVAFMEPMREAMRKSHIGMPVFQVMGNHDCNHFNQENPLSTEPDASGSHFEIKAQRAFEKTFGPINYSFNRGDVHIVAMRDVVYMTHEQTDKYERGFLKEQYEWLKQDLALVPKDKMVVLCVHIPLYSRATLSGEEGHYVKEVHELLDEFAEAHIISGHMHTQTNFQHNLYNIYEHNMASVCGAWWQSNITGDGVPNGYGVFIGKGNTFSDWYYMGYPKDMNTREHQMRLYRGNAITGVERKSKPKYSGYYAFNFGEEVLLANIYNADDSWTIEVYEDDMFTGYMTKVKQTDVSFNKLTGTYTMDDPRRIKDGTEAAYDMWVTGIHLSLNETTSSGRGWTKNSHFYKYELQDPSTENIKVRAIDRFGNEYIETKLTDFRDNAIAFKP